MENFSFEVHFFFLFLVCLLCPDRVSWKRTGPACNKILGPTFFLFFHVLYLSSWELSHADAFVSCQVNVVLPTNTSTEKILISVRAFMKTCVSGCLVRSDKYARCQRGIPLNKDWATSKSAAHRQARKTDQTQPAAAEVLFIRDGIRDTYALLVERPNE